MWGGTPRKIHKADFRVGGSTVPQSIRPGGGRLRVQRVVPLWFAEVAPRVLHPRDWADAKGDSLAFARAEGGSREHAFSLAPLLLIVLGDHFPYIAPCMLCSLDPEIGTIWPKAESSKRG